MCQWFAFYVCLSLNYHSNSLIETYLICFNTSYLLFLLMLKLTFIWPVTASSNQLLTNFDMTLGVFDSASTSWYNKMVQARSLQLCIILQQSICAHIIISLVQIPISGITWPEGRNIVKLLISIVRSSLERLYQVTHQAAVQESGCFIP